MDETTIILKLLKVITEIIPKFFRGEKFAKKNGRNHHLAVLVGRDKGFQFGKKSHLQNVERISAGFWKHLLSSVYMSSVQHPFDIPLHQLVNRSLQ